MRDSQFLSDSGKRKGQQYFNFSLLSSSNSDPQRQWQSNKPHKPLNYKFKGLDTQLKELDTWFKKLDTRFKELENQFKLLDT